MGNYPEESIQHSEHGESLKSLHINCMRMSHYSEGFNVEVVGFEEVWRSIISFLNALNIFFFQVKFLEFKVQNIVGTCDLRFPIRVENLNQMHGQFSRCVFIGWKVLVQDKGHLHTTQESGWSPLLIWVLWRTDNSHASAGNWITIIWLPPVARLIILIPWRCEKFMTTWQTTWDILVSIKA